MSTPIMSSTHTAREAIALALDVRWAHQKDQIRTHTRATQAASHLPRGGLDAPVPRITPSDLATVLRHLTSTSGPGAANRAVAAFRGALRVAHEEGWCGSPPPVRLNKEGPGRDYAPEEEDVEALVREIRSVCPESGALAEFLWLTGARLSEGLGVQGVITHGTGPRTVTFEDTKNGEPRKVALPMGCPHPPFKVSRSTFQRRFSEARARLALDPRLTPHALRHGRITALLAAGAPIPAVAHHVGHRSWKTTQRYSHPALKDSMVCAELTR